MQDLKIKIKERIKERRSLSFEEYLLHPYIISDPMISTYFKKLGYNNYNYDRKFGIADFGKEIIRDATVEEECAWWVLHTGRPKTRSSICNATDILKDKKVILEVIEK